MVVMMGTVFTSCTSDDSTEVIEETSNLVINRSSESEEVILSLEQSEEALMAQINEFQIANEASIEEGSLIEIKPTPNKRSAIMSLKNYDIHDIETRIEFCAAEINGDGSGCIKWFVDRLREGCSQIGGGELFGYAWAAFDCP